MDEYKQGATVQFKGGLGRGENSGPATLHIGIVNGPVQVYRHCEYVPVHFRETNHNLLVLSTNIVKVVSA